MRDIRDLKEYLQSTLGQLQDLRKMVAQGEQLNGSTLEEGYATADEIIYTFLVKEMNILAAEAKAKLDTDQHWQSTEGLVYYQTVREGRYVAFDRDVLTRTRRVGERNSSLALKAAKDLGYEVD